jgi:hypothetical protein
MLQHRACLLHRLSITVTGLETDIADRPAQAHWAQATVMAMEMHHRGSKALDTPGGEGLRVNIVAIHMVRMTEETSTMMATPMEEEEAKTDTRIMVARSAIATTNVKVKGMAARAEATTTTTKATVEDKVHHGKAPTFAKVWMCNPT